MNSDIKKQLGEDDTPQNSTATGKVWDSGVSRGKANPVSNDGTWESGVNRGKANPISNTGNWESGAVHGKANPVTTNESEGEYSGKTLMSCDVQPEYEKWLSFDVYEWAEMLNSHDGKIVFLYNGYDTLDMIREGDYKDWLFEKGVSEEVLMSARFYDKGYAFFRFCIDSNIEERKTVDLVKFMLANDVNDTRDMTEEFWDRFIEEFGHQDVRDLIEISSDCINIPSLMDFLQQYNNIVLCGGGANECLKEVEIALQALGKPYETYHEYVYEQKLAEQVKRVKHLMNLLG